MYDANTRKKILQLMTVRDVLCPELFKEGKLLPEIKSLLLDVSELMSIIIGDSFENVKIQDIVLCGGCANYTYHNNSGIDVGIVWESNMLTKEDFDKKLSYLNFSTIEPPFNLYIGNHLIFIKNMALMPAGSGIYSLKKDKWLSQPIQKEYEFNDYELYLKYQDLNNQVNNFMSSLPKNPDLSLPPQNCLKARNFYSSLAWKAFCDVKEKDEYCIEFMAYKCWKFMRRHHLMIKYIGDSYNLYINEDKKGGNNG